MIGCDTVFTKMEGKFIIYKAFFIFSILLSIFNVDSVKADNVQYQGYCSPDGFNYYVNLNNSGLELFDLYHAGVNLPHNYSSEYRDYILNTLDGKKIKYISSGIYNNNGDSRVSERCYVVKSESQIIIENTSAITKVGYNTRYTPYQCNQKYSAEDLKFVLASDYITNAEKNNYIVYDNYKEQKVSTSGKVT